MTNMTDAEISRRLALAIGWEDQNLSSGDNAGSIWINYRLGYWRLFDYRDPAVIWPIAERFDCFPLRLGKEWAAQKMHGKPVAYSDTATKAVALAVIKAKE